MNMIPPFLPGQESPPRRTLPVWQRPDVRFQEPWLPERFMRSTLLHLGMLADEARADMAGAFLAMKGYTRDDGRPPRSTKQSS